MDYERAVEQQRAGHARPDLDREFETSLRRIERDEAERMVDEMRRDIEEKNEAGRQAQGPTDPAQLRNQSLAPQFDADGCCPLRAILPLKRPRSLKATLGPRRSLGVRVLF
jgi:hypothetical protein